MMTRMIAVGLIVCGLAGSAWAEEEAKPEKSETLKICEQRLAIMGQIVEDMSRARAIVSTAEVEAASLKVQVKTLKEEIEAAKKKAEEKKTN